MTTSDKPYTFDRVVRMVITLVLFGLFGFLIWYLRGVLVPFAIAMLIAYLMNPLVNLIQKRVENRVLSVVLSIMAVTVVLGGIAIVMVPLMIAEVQHLGQLLQGFVENNEMAQRAKDMLPENIWKAIKEQIQREEVQEFFKSEKFLEIPGFLFQNVLPDAFTVISSTVSTVFLLAVGVATVILYLVFLLIDFGKVQDRWSKLIPAQYREKVVEFVNAFEDGMSKYFRGQALVAASVGVICATGYTIIGLPLGILLGLFVGLLNTWSRICR
ncbi:MAG: AI-2E family transporter [Planctomycetota bacterium]|nr:AI-2E family transporter [Planctomycetota bacterium]